MKISKSAITFSVYLTWQRKYVEKLSESNTHTYTHRNGIRCQRTVKINAQSKLQNLKLDIFSLKRILKPLICSNLKKGSLKRFFFVPFFGCV